MAALQTFLIISRGFQYFKFSKYMGNHFKILNSAWISIVLFLVLIISMILVLMLIGCIGFSAYIFPNFSFLDNAFEEV